MIDMCRYKVVLSRRCESDNPITVYKDEEVKCLEESNPDGDWAGWILCKTTNNEGWIPYQIIDRVGNTGKMMEDYCAKEFDLNVGEVLIKQKELNGWIWCYKDGLSKDMAWAPLNCIEAIE
jgi:hypothetical protein